MQLKQVTLTKQEVNADLMRALLDLIGATQEELAAATGISASRISRLRTGNAKWRAEEVDAVADSLSIPAEVLSMTSAEAVARLAGAGHNPDPDGGSRNPNVTIRNLKVISGSKPKRLVPTNQSDLEDAA